MTPLETAWCRGDGSSVQAASSEHLCLRSEDKGRGVLSGKGHVVPLHNSGLFPGGPVPESLVRWL